MRRIALLVLFSMFLASCAAAGNRALLIGIGHYEVAGAELPGVDQDIKMMVEVAGKLGFTPSQTKTLSHSEATLDAIRDTIEDWLIDGTTPSDRVLFYHSGHGTLVADENGDEEDGYDEALLPYDFNGGLPHEKGGPKPTRVLLDDELGKLLKKIPAREVVVLVDSCHSGTMTRAIRRQPRQFDRFYTYPGMPAGPPSSLIDKRILKYESVILVSAAESLQEAQTSKQGALFTQGIYQAVVSAESRRQLTIEELRSEAEAYIYQAVGNRLALRHKPALDGNLNLRRLNIFLPEPVAAASKVDPQPVIRQPVTPPASSPPPPPPPVVKPKPQPIAPPPPQPVAPPPPQPVAPPPVVKPADSARGELWNRLEGLVEGANAKLGVRTSTTSYRVGQSLDISVTAPGDGYLHILNLGDGEDEMVMLFPNHYQPNNKVRGDDIIRLPDPDLFRLPAHLPDGRSWQRNLVVVIHTVSPLNLFDSAQAAAEIFQVLDGSTSRSLVRSFGVAGPAARAKAYSAGQVVVNIKD